MAAQTESPFRCAARPNGLQVDAHRRKTRDVKNREQAFSKFLRLFEFKRNSTKPQVNHARPALRQNLARDKSAGRLRMLLQMGEIIESCVRRGRRSA